MSDEQLPDDRDRATVPPPAVTVRPESLAEPTPRRRPPLLLIVALTLAGLVGVGAIAGLVLYDQVTKIDRSNPAVVTRQFLDAAVVDRDAAGVSLFVCRAWSVEEALASTTVVVHPALRVNWGVTSVREDGNRAEVTVQMTFTVAIAQPAPRQVELWTLVLVREKGWRVCSLSRGQSHNP